MINITTNYYVYSARRGFRHRGTTSQTAIIPEIVSQNEPRSQSTEQTYYQATAWSELVYNNANVPFAFMCINGAADGNRVEFEPGNYQIMIGETDIRISIYYLPVGGISINGGGPGIWVDAYNVEIGDFTNSDFMEVLLPPTPPDNIDPDATANANYWGEVSSIEARTIRSYQEVDAAPFIRWRKVTRGATSINTLAFTLNQNQSGEIWFAFYQRMPIDYRFHGFIEEVLRRLGQLYFDIDCGNHPIDIPIPLPYPLDKDGEIEFKKMVNALWELYPEHAKMLEYLLNEYPAKVLDVYNSTTNLIELLNKISISLKSK